MAACLRYHHYSPGDQVLLNVSAYLGPYDFFGCLDLPCGWSGPFDVTLGDADDPGTLEGMQPFVVFLPEPSFLTLLVLGGTMLAAGAMKRWPLVRLGR